MFDLSLKLDERSQQGLRRSRRIVESPQGINLICDGKAVVNFCSNDYLGLANHPDVINAFKSASDKYGVGSGSAHLICGHSRAHHALEEELAAFTGRDRALLFSTGYMANMGAISALVGRGDTVLEDRLNHASLLDGGLLSGARFKRYAHGDVEHLQNLLGNSEANKNSVDIPHPSPLPKGEGISRRLIVTDGVFSMDGDIAPVQALSAVAKRHDAWLMVDDAHGLGVLGDNGVGILEELKLSQDDVQVLVGTLGKAFGTFGAFVAGSEELIETLIQRARPYVYTTALPPVIAEATRTSLKLIQSEGWRREKLRQLTSRFRTGAEQLGLPLMASTSPIQPILIGESEQAVAVSNALFNQGFLVSAIRPPTVPVNAARLRVTFSAMHEELQIDQLLDALAKAIA
ncbi:8-amino-7-oxononanoate synthase BioF [Methyloglobulus morosus KoM1]|uniref:8-amino-7-oxononanoate synthase n=1 Tax=Methyloglobulus morosus KoM1 TaxID=1116472 RepID=V5C1F6_9GAMM|nr:8-amino-7-oxononanoate synthase [Methyloglobulus morosus]ESS72312.1 8-amino-7-oxononanoate synthase BioF [Methyloglobulus morosus KoM1]